MLSVFMPNYNHARHLPAALDSLLAQSYRPREIIVLDDASTDASVEIIESYAVRDPRIRLIRNDRNLGVVASLNRLIEMAAGPYLFGLAADDKILPGFLEKSMNLLARHPQAGLSSTLSHIMDENGRRRGVFMNPLSGDQAGYLAPDQCLSLLRYRGNFTHSNATIYRKEALIEAGGFRPELASHCDAFVQQVIVLRHGACFIPEPLAAWRRAAGDYSAVMDRDFQKLLQIGRNSSRLMRTTYQDLFPPDLVKSLERRYLLAVGHKTWRGLAWKQERFLAEMTAGLGPWRAGGDKPFLILMKLTLWLHVLSGYAYFGLRFGSIGQLLAKRLHHLWHNRGGMRPGSGGYDNLPS
ncbi:MAG: glycosyltransferase family A protein [Thermodesulfobacteriota bacterium]